MRTRIPMMVAWCAVGCGPVIDPEVDPETSGTSVDTTESGTPQPTTVDVATGDPTSEPPPSTLSGDYLLAIAWIIMPETPLQWRATIVHDTGTGTATMQLQPLSLDVGATTTPRMPVGDAVQFATDIAPDGHFRLELGEYFLDGAANPITGSDIIATMAIEGTAIGRELWCGAASGMVTEPLDLDLLGSTFALTPVDGGVLPSDPIATACP